MSDTLLLTLKLVIAYLAALSLASFVASFAMFGGTSTVIWVITMWSVAVTALPLYGIALAAGRPNWAGATFIGLVATMPALALNWPSDLYELCRTFILPGALGGFTFHVTLQGIGRIWPSLGPLP